MAKKTVTICDRCGVEYEEFQGNTYKGVTIETKRYKGKDRFRTINIEHEKLDLCQHCHSSFFEWKNMSTKPEED